MEGGLERESPMLSMQPLSSAFAGTATRVSWVLTPEGGAQSSLNATSASLSHHCPSYVANLPLRPNTCGLQPEHMQKPEKWTIRHYRQKSSKIDIRAASQPQEDKPSSC